MTKIQWNKMHVKNYDGTCANCGGRCEDEASINEWTKCDAEIDRLLCAEWKTPDYKRRQYLMKRRAECLNYLFFGD